MANMGINTTGGVVPGMAGTIAPTQPGLLAKIGTGLGKVGASMTKHPLPWMLGLNAVSAATAPDPYQQALEANRKRQQDAFQGIEGIHLGIGEGDPNAGRYRGGGILQRLRERSTIYNAG